MEKKTIDFEKAFERLELILEKLNSGTTSLEESLKLYEEADKLILYCHGKLTQAERTIEVLMKNREDQLLLQNNAPKTEPLQNMQ